MSTTTVPAAPAMADDEKEKSTNQILQALDALSHTLYQARSNLRSTSLALPRSTVAADVNDAVDAAGADAPRPRSRRLSLMAPFRSRSSSKLNKSNENGDDDDDDDDDDDEDDTVAPLKNTPGFAGVAAAEAAAEGETKKGRIWSWAPIRALSHIGMRRMGCLFSVEVVAAQGLPPSMNGLRLAVAVRKKEARDGAVQTMPARVQEGAADFDETLFIRCHLYGTGGGATGKPLKFEPRPFLLSLLAVEAPELDFGRSAVDLSLFAKEFTDKCQQGECVRQWDMAFPLAGKATGGELVVKLAFQSIDDGGGAGMYSQPEPAAEVEKTSSSSSSSLSSLARKIRKSSFSMMLTPRVTRTDPLLATSKVGVPAPDMRGIDNFKLDDDVATPPVAEAEEDKRKETEEQHKEALDPVAEVQQTEAPEPVTEVQQTEAPEPVAEEVQHKEAMEAVTVEQKHKEAPEKVTEEVQQKETEPAEDAQAENDVEIPELDVVDKGVEVQEEKADVLKEEAAGEEAVKDVLEPSAIVGDVAAAAAESVELPPQPQEEATTVVDDAKEESSQVPDQGAEGGKDDAAGKSRQGGFGWRTIAIVVAPVAVVVSKALAGR